MCFTTPCLVARPDEVALADSEGAAPDAAFLAELLARSEGAAERPSVQQISKLRCGEDDVAKVLTPGWPPVQCVGCTPAVHAMVNPPTSGGMVAQRGRNIAIPSRRSCACQHVDKQTLSLRSVITVRGVGRGDWHGEVCNKEMYADVAFADRR